MLILEDLYLGDVRPSERSVKRNSQYGKFLSRTFLSPEQEDTLLRG